MSHSITTTASYVLNKYSRSYPPAPSGQGTRAPVESEWQHFTNPVMRIVLDAKKSPSGQLLSLRLRISWSIQTVPDDLHVDQREVVFEDLELLSFSSLPTFQASATLQSDQGLPLKAVYRDTVVGIRYLHPKIVPPGSHPTYRRFQITFKDVLDASRSIDAIKSVCPCKANPQPTQINRRSTMLSSSLTRAATTIPGPTTVRSARLPESQSVTLTPIDAGPVASAMPIHPPEIHPFAIAPSSVATSLSSDDSAFVTCSEASQRADAQVNRHQEDRPKSRARESAQNSLANPSQPSSSNQSITMPPPPVPRRATHVANANTCALSGTVNTGGERSQLIASLGQHPPLYELSRTDLETLVSQVIREDGFLHLLESLDSLWRVKGFLGR